MTLVKPEDGALGARIMGALLDWKQFSEQEGQLTRLYLSQEHLAAADAVMHWMTESGMSAHMDAVGNVIGRYEAEDPDARTLMTGSHIDTVRNAGAFDGTLGVALPIACIEALHQAGKRLPFAVEVIAFGDEEGVRFPCTMSGSLAVTGRFPPENLNMRDADGLTLQQAMRNFGGDPQAIASTARKPRDILGFIEVHIEQGPVLEAENLPVGVVTAINGASRLTVHVSGLAGHAGTVPMELRTDALAGAAEMIIAIEKCALAIPNTVATVGKIEASPGAVNVIPGAVEMTIDIRAPNDSDRIAVVEEIGGLIKDIASKRGLTASSDLMHRVGSTTCDQGLADQLETAITGCGFKPRRLPSGAGHDAMVMASLCPIGMLFVRCAGGISHNPAESIHPKDADAAAQVFLQFLQGFEAPDSHPDGSVR